jgi:hypothetical protein
VKRLLLFLVVFLQLTNCRQKGIDLTKIKWQPVDTALSAYFEKKGSEGIGEKYEVVFVGYLDETKHNFIDSSVVKNFVGLAIPTMQDYLQSKLPRLISKGSKGYLKISLYDLAVSSAKVDVYLNNNIKEQEKDSLLSFIGKRKEVRSVSFISKDSAIKSMMKEYADLSSILNDNPLPASISVVMKKEYAEDEELETFKQMLLKQFPSLIESANYPQLHAGAFKGNALVFHFSF